MPPPAAELTVALPARPPRPVATYGLIALNVLVFLLEIPGGTTSAANLLGLGAMIAPAPWLGHQWWRLLTAGFLHDGVVHLGLNAFALAVFGADLERRLGHGRLLVCYLVSGPAAMALLLLATTLFGLGPEIVVGASASVMGVVGATLSVLALAWWRDRRRAPAWELWLLLAIVVSEVGFDLVTPRVSLLGHAGGLVSGLVLGALLSR